MKSNIISIFLLFCLVAPLTTTFIWLKHQKATIRREVKWNMIASLDKEELVLLKFTKKEGQEKLKWKHSKEFEYNGQMYDIVETEIHGNTTYYWCWWDYKETALNKKLTTLLANFLDHNQQSKNTKIRFSNFYQSLFYSKSKPWEALQIKLISEKKYIYNFNYTSLHFPPPSPPPNYS